MHSLTEQSGKANKQNSYRKDKSLLRTIGLLNLFWAEVAKTAYYVVNRLPYTVIRLKTQMEIWIRKLFDYSHLHANDKGRSNDIGDISS